MIEAMASGAILRFVQAAIQASPTILIGLLVAGVFRRLLGHEGTRRLFGGDLDEENPRPRSGVGIVLVVSGQLLRQQRDVLWRQVGNDAVKAFPEGVTADARARQHLVLNEMVQVAGNRQAVNDGA